MPSVLSDVLLPSKAAAAVTGLAEQSLKQARCNTPRSARHDLFVPMATAYGKRQQGYSLAALLQWSRASGKPLRWSDCPLSVCLPAFDAMADAGLELPEALRERIAGLAR